MSVRCGDGGLSARDLDPEVGLAGSVLVEAHDDWRVADKRYLSETSLALLTSTDPDTETHAPTAALTA
jgi:putative transposase